MSNGDIHIKNDEELNGRFNDCLCKNSHNRSMIIRKWIKEYIEKTDAETIKCIDTRKKGE